jgi:DNA-binding MarR family transcriptional regulator
MVDLTRQNELNNAIELMHFGYRAMTAEPDQILARLGLGRVHHRILYFVARLPGAGVNQLLRTLQVSKQALNAPLRDLYARKLIAYERSIRDARVKELTLTSAGARLERRLSALQRRQFTAIFAVTGSRAELGWKSVMGELARPELERSGRRLG